MQKVIEWILAAIEENYSPVETDKDIGGQTAQNAQNGERDDLHCLVRVLQSKVRLEDVGDVLLVVEPDRQQSPEECAHGGSEEAVPVGADREEDGYDLDAVQHSTH